MVMPNKFGFNRNLYDFYGGKTNCKILDTWSIASEAEDQKVKKK